MIANEDNQAVVAALVMNGADRCRYEPVFRARVFRARTSLSADGVVLCLVFDHMAIDGIGSGILFNLLARCCRNRSRGAAVVVPGWNY